MPQYGHESEGLGYFNLDIFPLKRNAVIHQELLLVTLVNAENSSLI